MSSEREFTFDCTFDVPVQRGGSMVQEASCTSPTGASVSFTVNDEKGGAGKGLRVFAGVRSEPFIICEDETRTYLKIADCCRSDNNVE